MTFVIDASVAAVWGLDDEDDASAMALLDRLAAEPAVAPSLFWFEVRSLLLRAERRARAGPANTGRFMALLETLPIRLAPLPASGALLDTARRHRLTGYDAAYLELAGREGLALATLDQVLARAALVEGVALMLPAPS